MTTATVYFVKVGDKFCGPNGGLVSNPDKAKTYSFGYAKSRAKEMKREWQSRGQLITILSLTGELKEAME
jgi:hypothetical protein